MTRTHIVSINRHRMGTDGNGITTLVGLWGCHLRCEYCFNPECRDPSRPGADYTPEQLLDELSADAPYFLMSDGGVTFGGGEPLLSSSFIREFCALADPRWKINLETSLNIGWEQIEPLVPHIDAWYIDIKDLDPEIYSLYTAADNTRVIRNLNRLIHTVPANHIHLRVPYIPEYNDPQHVEWEQLLLDCAAWQVQTFAYVTPESHPQLFRRCKTAPPDPDIQGLLQPHTGSNEDHLNPDEIHMGGILTLLPRKHSAEPETDRGPAP